MSAPAPGMTVGVLLAAGRGRRMGTLKQLLPWGECENSKPLVAVAFDALAHVCDAMIVVLGIDQQAVVEALRPRALDSVKVDSDLEMMESVRAGLARAVQVEHVMTFLLHPADHPFVPPAVIEALHRAARGHPGCAVMPEHRGRGGHPVLIPAELSAEILTWRGSGGLRSFWEANPHRCVRIAVDDPSIVFDIDTLEDFQRGYDRGTRGRDGRITPPSTRR